MHRSAHWFCVAMLLATPAAAQSTTEDGIRAMVAGDYRAAGRILRPLADHPGRPDPVAQFFLAFLYETGRGVTFDKGRACVLFVSAARHAHPFAEQAAAIAAALREQLGDGASLFCPENEGWLGGPPLSFVLGPEHTVVFADTSIRVRDGDRESRTVHRLPVGARFLPVQYTGLQVTQPVVARRHFFHWFLWTPDTTVNPTSWTLGCLLSEVVGDQWVFILAEQKLAVVAGAVPPASYDVARLVSLRTNARGEAEVAVAGGPVPRIEAIPWRGSR